MNTKSNQIIRHGLWLAVLLFGFLSVGQEAHSQTKDTLWTRDVWPLYVINGVFSPDDQFIYATGASDSYGKGPFTVLKYDLQGNLLSKIDSIGGIRQFSEDGRFFWNYYGDLYNAVQNHRIVRIVDNLGRTNINFGASFINEKTDIGIIYDGGNVVKTEDYQYIFHNLVLFHPSDMSIISDTSYPGGIYDFYSVAIHPTSGKMALYLHDSRWNDNVSTYTSRVEKIEIWDIKTLSKEREIMTRNISEDEHEAIGFLKYSLDGSVLGYQHDGKLTLYSTNDYSVVWESTITGIYYFNWTIDMKNIYFSIWGLLKYKYPQMEYDHLFTNFGESKFINFNKDNSLILSSFSTARLYLLDNTVTSVTDPIFTENYKTKITQNQINTDLILSIDAIQPNIAEFTITNLLGDVLQSSIPINIIEGYNQFAINIADFPTGIYFLSLTISGRTHTLKFALVR